jgi:hypothetical protein
MSEEKEASKSSALKDPTPKGSAPAFRLAEGDAAVPLDEESQMTCNVLCELASTSTTAEESSSCEKKKSAGKSSCSKQLQ